MFQIIISNWMKIKIHFFFKFPNLLLCSFNGDHVTTSLFKIVFYILMSAVLLNLNISIVSSISCLSIPFAKFIDIVPITICTPATFRYLRYFPFFVYFLLFSTVSLSFNISICSTQAVISAIGFLYGGSENTLSHKPPQKNPPTG